MVGGKLIYRAGERASERAFLIISMRAERIGTNESYQIDFKLRKELKVFGNCGFDLRLRSARTLNAIMPR